jgi:hypothetical protein
MVVRDLPKVEARVRFPLPAPSYAKATEGRPSYVEAMEVLPGFSVIEPCP